jgi:hypothetical protein
VWADQLHVPRVNASPIEPIDPAPLSHVTRPFFSSLSHFLISLNHFAITPSNLLRWIQTFCYSELSHFATVSFTLCTTVLSHSLLIQCLVISYTTPLDYWSFIIARHSSLQRAWSTKCEAPTRRAGDRSHRAARGRSGADWLGSLT